MAYTKFKYIAYDVSTVGDATVPVYGIPAGNISNAPELKGNDNLKGDAWARVCRFIKVLKQAKDNLSNADKNTNTLKIFMAPEFYFRPNNELNCYTETEYKSIVKTLKNTIGNSDDYRDWLVICGTIIWYQTENDIKGKEHKILRNTCLTIRNKKIFNDTNELEKVRYSDIDGIPYVAWGTNTATLYPNFTEKELYSNDIYYSTKRNPPLRHTKSDAAKNILKVNGLKIGLEICKDHIVKSREVETVNQNDEVTKNKKKLGRGIMRWLQDEFPNEYAKNSLHLQLLPAGGMPIEDTSVAVKKNGFILRCDGFAKSTNGVRTQLQLVTRYEYCKLRYLGSDKPVKISNPYKYGNFKHPQAILSDQTNGIKRIALSGDSVIADPTNGHDQSWPNQDLVFFPTQKI